MRPAGGEFSRVMWMLLFVAALHSLGLFSPFIIDDYVYLATVHDLDWRGVADIFTSSTMGEEASGVWWTPPGPLPFYRPIGEMTFAVDYSFWGMQPFGYHLTNLILHVTCTFLVWRLSLRLFDSPVSALTAATVFALHPVHNEAVVWISGRFDLLVCLCLLAFMLAYLNWQRGGPRSWRWGGLSVLWFVVGLGCKETALVLPAVLVAAELLRWRGPAAPYHARRLVTAAGMYGAIALLYLGIRFALFAGLGTLPPPYGLDLSSPLIAARGVAWNLTQYLLDFALFIHVDAIYLAEFWSSNHVLLAAVTTGAVLICVGCAKLAWRSRAFRVGLVWSVLFTAPAMLAMPGERNVYSSAVGVALIAAAALAALRRRYDTRPVPGQWVRRSAYALVGFWIVLGMIEHGIGWCVAASSEKVFHDLEALVPDPPAGTRIYVVNQCPLNAVGFNQAIQLRWGRSDLSACALSLSPRATVTSTDEIVQTGPAQVRIVRKGGVFFQSFVERFLLFSAPPSSLPESSRRFDLELVNPPSSFDRVTDLEFRFPYPLTDPRVRIFIWNNERIRALNDLVELMNRARLERWGPVGTRHAG